MPRTQGSQNVRARSQHESGRAAAHTRKSRDGDGQEGPDRGESGAQRGGPVKSSHVIEEHIDLGVPRDSAFEQWTRYQDLAKYSKHESGQPKRANRIGFRSKIGPSSRGWDAQIVEQVPGRRIAWRSMGGARHLGVVTFHSLDARLTRMMVQMEYHPAGAVETVGNFFRMQRRRVRKDLRLFKHFIELRGEAVGKGASQKVSGGGLQQETDERLGTGGEGGEASEERRRAHEHNGAGDEGRGRGRRRAS
jgi:uncharacterized membrane protein